MFDRVNAILLSPEQFLCKFVYLIFEALALATSVQ